MQNNTFFPVLIKEVPSKKEIQTVLNDFMLSKIYTPCEKYVIAKAYEYFIKEAISSLKDSAIKDFLETRAGSTSEQIFGANVKITGERKNITRKKYTYSDEVAKIEKEIELKSNELKFLQDSLKLRQTLEINQNIAKTDIITESQEPEYGITIILPNE